MRWKDKKYDSILKAVGYNASTDVRIMAIAKKETVLAACFCPRFGFEDPFSHSNP